MILRSKRTPLTGGALLLSAAVLLAACGSSSQAADSEATDSEAAAPLSGDEAQSSPEPTEVSGENAILATVGGGQIDFGSLAGQDTLLWFWAPW